MNRPSKNVERVQWLTFSPLGTWKVAKEVFTGFTTFHSADSEKCRAIRSTSDFDYRKQIEK